MMSQKNQNTSVHPKYENPPKNLEDSTPLKTFIPNGGQSSYDDFGRKSDRKRIC